MGGRTPGGGAHAAVTPDPVNPGRITVEERALIRVAEAVSAEALDVDRSKLSVSLGAAGGGLGLQLRTALSVPDLDDDPAVDAAGSIIERLAIAQAAIRDRATAIMGRPVSRVDIRITGAVVAERSRVL